MNSEKYDAIIIGQGISGSLLAWVLNEQGKKTLLIDANETNTASKIAAGIINPVSGPRVVKQDNAEQLLSAADELYTDIEKRLKIQFYQTKSFRRIFQTDDEMNYWQTRCNDPAYNSFIQSPSPIDINEKIIDLFNDPIGSGLQSQVKHVDTTILLAHLLSYFKARDLYICEKIDYGDIQLLENGIRIGLLEAKQLIFCEGYQAINNPWFNWLPFKNAKGEIISMETSIKLNDQIVNFGRWFLPLADNLFKFGSNYEWDIQNEAPSQENKKLLVKEFSRSLLPEFRQQFPFHIVNHQSGIRPCTKDRSVFIGTHPSHPQLSMFNGFGSKGLMLIPFFAQRFYAYLYKNRPLGKTDNIARYYK